MDQMIWTGSNRQPSAFPMLYPVELQIRYRRLAQLREDLRASIPVDIIDKHDISNFKQKPSDFLSEGFCFNQLIGISWSLQQSISQNSQCA